jgi:hypothetical protein
MTKRPMTETKWVKLEELRQPGMRRVLEAMRLIEEDAPGLVDEATLAAAVLAKRRNEGGRIPQ